jgi:uncharacterized LabA/DUF88 family protein
MPDTVYIHPRIKVFVDFWNFQLLTKGVDALIVTDMISLAWENSYDFAVLASSDRDLIPAVKYLSGKGKKVIHAGFRSIGSDLSKSCWAAFDISPKIREILR